MTNNNTKPQDNQKPVVIVLLIFCIIMSITITITAIILLVNRNQQSDTTSYEIINIHEDTPTLSLYKKLPNQMTVEALKKEASEVSPEFEVKLYQDGHGEISIPNQSDTIYFGHNLIVDEYDDPNSIVDPRTITEVTDYQPTEAINDIKYVFFEMEAGYAIGYNEDENVYEVSDMGEVYQFATKEEAINSYLAPVVTEQ